MESCKNVFQPDIVANNERTWMFNGNWKIKCFQPWESVSAITSNSDIVWKQQGKILISKWLKFLWKHYKILLYSYPLAIKYIFAGAQSEMYKECIRQSMFSIFLFHSIIVSTHVLSKIHEIETFYPFARFHWCIRINLQIEEQMLVMFLMIELFISNRHIFVSIEFICVKRPTNFVQWHLKYTHICMYATILHTCFHASITLHKISCKNLFTHFICKSIKN